MVQQQKFCVRCGQPLSPGVSFCQSCGTPIAGQSAPVASQSIPAAYSSTPAAASVQMPVYQQAQQRRKPNILLILVGIVMILAGLIQPAAHLFGQKATASITKVDQRIDSSSDKLEYNYQISYAFSVDGKQYNGNYHMNKVYNVSKLPKIGSSLPIKYLAMMPGINAPTNQGNPFIFLLVVSGLGILLLIVGIKGNAGKRR
ncbi:MAG: zinc ribbon domain-containing protein [Bacillota bacterium]|nr:zinc ribbon domain-containing protein [Bacillota bacterium]